MVKPDMMFYGVPVYFSTIGNLQYGAAFTLPGIGIFINPKDRKNISTLRHEYGHWLDGKDGRGRIGGWAFYVYAIPTSVMSAAISKNNTEHQNSWTEIRANNLAYEFFGRPADWRFQEYPVSDGVRYPQPPNPIGYENINYIGYGPAFH